ncbi:MAG: class I SAM-dependent methyltransferase [Thermoguttaceae bacterium]|nr:class I SAM-dependent methyltransferase [Thermoguttaceae bacterium]
MAQAEQSDSFPGPFRLDRLGDLGPVRRALQRAGYTETAVSETVLADREGRPLDTATLTRRTQSPSPFHTLLRLFALGMAVPEPAAREALAPADLDELCAIGLLERRDEGVRAATALMPSDDFYLAREFWPDFTGRPRAPDYVLEVGPATRAAACLTVRRQGETALDLGTGNGYLALTAARHAARVIGTDINLRALNFAAFNARLNDLPAVEFRAGSLFEPVADERFDLIVANPPFVISPRSTFEYRDSGMPGDSLVEQVVRQAPSLLRDDGYATVLMNWHHRSPDDWAQRPAQWLASSGCDAWLLGFESYDPIQYAASWLRPEYADQPERYARAMDDWLAYLDRLGAGRISFGAVVLRRRAGRNWFRADPLAAGMPPSGCSDQIRRVFAAQDLLESLQSDEALLAQSLRLTPEHQMEQVLVAESGRWLVKAARIRQTQGYPFEGNIDRLVGTILADCDGRHRLGDLVADLARQLGADPAQVAPSCCRVMRTLLAWGFLTAAT